MQLEETIQNVIAEYFPNIITEGPRGPLYDVDYQRDRPANVSYKGGATI